MIQGHNHGRHIEARSRAKAAFLFASLRQVETGQGAAIAEVVEEDGMDALTSTGEDTEGDNREAENRLDIRDLLLDETD